MRGRVAGKSALVTGAARGLGAACARQLAREGAQVLLTDINHADAEAVAADINQELSSEVAWAALHDVTSEADWSHAVGMAVTLMGGLSVLVNNAGSVTVGTIEELSLSEWRHAMAMNADSAFIGIRAALPVMKQAPRGSIINVSSISAMVAGPNFVSYNASKAAVWMLTKSVALHCARSRINVRCNSVHPTFMRTAMLDTLVGGACSEQKYEKLIRQVPLGRLGEPEEVASLIVYLASDESGFVTGAEFKIDGGLSAQ